MEFNKIDFEYEVEEILNAYAKTYVRTATNLIKNEAERAIAKFYLDYTPTYYNRTDNLRHNSILTDYHNKGDGRYYGYVQISSESMDPYGTQSERLGMHSTSASLDKEPKSKTDTHAIASDAWLSGIHGLHSLPHMNPFPYSILEKYYKNKNFQSQSHQEALNAAIKSKHYMLTIT